VSSPIIFSPATDRTLSVNPAWRSHWAARGQPADHVKPVEQRREDDHRLLGDHLLRKRKGNTGTKVGGGLEVRFFSRMSTRRQRLEEVASMALQT